MVEYDFEKYMAVKSENLSRIDLPVLPEQGESRVRIVDFEAQMEKYSPDERRVMGTNMCGWQATNGCEGNCPFCLFHEKGEQRGIRSIYRENTLAEGMRLIQPNKNTMMYFAQDPMVSLGGEFDHPGKILD